jgi:hypothetical protein
MRKRDKENSNICYVYKERERKNERITNNIWVSCNFIVRLLFYSVFITTPVLVDRFQFFFVLFLNSCLYCHINFKSLPHPSVEIFALKDKKTLFGWLIQTETYFSSKEREIKEKVNSTFCRATLRLSKHMIHKFILFSLCDRLVRQYFYTHM